MAFQLLSIELNEHIATFLEDDRDLYSYMLICPETHNAVHARRAVIWRSFFARKYDLPPGRSGQDIMVQYMRRNLVLKNGITQGFRRGHSSVEAECLETLRQLVVEAFSGPSCSHHYEASNNLFQLRRFATNSNLLEDLRFSMTLDLFTDLLARIDLGVSRNDHEGRLLQTIQAVLAHLHFDLSIDSLIRGFGGSQQAVYGHPQRMPLFLDKKGTINMTYLLHVINFFKYHMKTETEHTLYPLLCDLPWHERPSEWDKPIDKDGHLQLPGLQWKGSYAYIPELDDLHHIRSRDLQDQYADDAPVPDAIDYDEGFQTLQLDSLPQALAAWPPTFERHLHALPSKQLLEQMCPVNGAPRPELATARRSGRGTYRDRRISSSVSYNNLLPERSTVQSHIENRIPLKMGCKGALRTGTDYLMFTGSGFDQGHFHCSGVLHNLPPQSGVPGWQRMSMMKYLADPASPSSSQTSTQSSSAAALSGSSSISSASSLSPTGINSLDVMSSDPFAMGAEQTAGDMVVDESCWCYEGIIIPGGKIALGRWWHPLDEECMATGPFIFWNVDARVAVGP